jgi:hypothetical protein
MCRGSRVLLAEGMTALHICSMLSVQRVLQPAAAAPCAERTVCVKYSGGNCCGIVCYDPAGHYWLDHKGSFTEARQVVMRPALLLDSAITSA